MRGLKTIEEREKWFLEYVVKNNRGETPQHPPFYAGPETAVGGWKAVLAAEEKHYQPGKFTTIPAFEWSAAPKGGNLHRNVFFRDTHVPERPMSYVDINREEALWTWLAGLEKQGMKVIAIPHNSNASKGMMFAPQDSKGDPINLEYAEMRSRFEPLIEMMQIKGNSEVHRWFWDADEFANFENADSLGDYSGRDLKKFGKTELGPLGCDQGPRLREVARRESLPLRLRRRHGQPQRHSLERRRRQLRGRQSRCGRRHRRAAADERGRRLAQRQGPESRRADRRVGASEYPRGDLGRR